MAVTPLTGWLPPLIVSSKSATSTPDVASMPRNQFMLKLAGVSACGPPLVTSGIALAMPPVPVLMPTPAPSRRNQVSTVKVVALRPEPAPKVTKSLLPSRSTAEPTGVVGVAVASFEDPEALVEPSTAVTT